MQAADALGRFTGRFGRAIVLPAGGVAGLLRVDFFLRPDGTRIVNEVNTFPGFTSVSQYPRMWQAAGLGYGDLLDVLVDTALGNRGTGLPGPGRPGSLFRSA